ncbi:hypothetical protein GJ744_002194 [Endocarpon pusillum]|uniref:Uncharacterized protein n=1 Tax=Endocarpon pusillum TaxID=364733 RepID=A0A8H7AC68_9EURO|nr:hypothetical protein GJ744_002194 [Endocarpon pusillum]
MSAGTFLELGEVCIGTKDASQNFATGAQVLSLLQVRFCGQLKLFYGLLHDLENRFYTGRFRAGQLHTCLHLCCLA